MPLALLACAVDGSGTPTVPDGTPSAADQAVDDVSSGKSGQAFPDIVAAELIPAGEGVFDVEVTVSSPYDTPQRYADGWRVLAPDGTVLGTHDLAHDHAGEQPFTRTQRGLLVPAGVDSVTVEGRDLVHGYWGGTLVVDVPAAPSG
jgi:hypothetical protein